MGPAASCPQPLRRKTKITLFVFLAVLVVRKPDGPLKKRSHPISRVLSRTIIHLGFASPRTSSDLPGNLHGPCMQLALRVPLFGLAPSGVCRAVTCCHRRGALLPHRFTLATLAGSAVYFLLHFPWTRIPQVLPGALPWEPGLSSMCVAAHSDCLADSTHKGITLFEHEK